MIIWNKNDASPSPATSMMNVCCPFCLTSPVFYDQYSLLNHVKVKHPESNQFDCIFCSVCQKNITNDSAKFVKSHWMVMHSDIIQSEMPGPCLYIERYINTLSSHDSIFCSNEQDTIETDLDLHDSSASPAPELLSLLRTPVITDALSEFERLYLNISMASQSDEKDHALFLTMEIMDPLLLHIRTLQSLVDRFETSLSPLLHIEKLQVYEAGYFSLFSALRLFLLFDHTAMPLLKVSELTKRLLESPEPPSDNPVYGPGWSTPTWTESFESSRAKWEPKAKAYKGKVIFCHIILSVFEYKLVASEVLANNQVIEISLAEIDADQSLEYQGKKGHWLPISVINKDPERVSLDQIIENLANELQMLEEGVEIYSDHLKEPLLLIGSLYQITGDNLGKTAILGMPKQIHSTNSPCLNCTVSSQQLQVQYSDRDTLVRYDARPADTSGSKLLKSFNFATQTAVEFGRVETAIIRIHFNQFRSNFISEHGKKFYELVKEFGKEMGMGKIVPNDYDFSGNQLLWLLLISPLVILMMDIPDNPHANLWCLHAEHLAILVSHVWDEDLIHRSKILINQLCYDLPALYPGCLDKKLLAHKLHHLPDQARVFGSIRNCFGLSLSEVYEKFHNTDFVDDRYNAVEFQHRLLLKDVSSGMSPSKKSPSKDPVYIFDKEGNWYHNVAPLIKEGTLVQDSQDRFGFVVTIDQENQTVIATLARTLNHFCGRSYPVVAVDEHETVTLSMVGMRVFYAHPRDQNGKKVFYGVEKLLEQF